ncbi:hypothetical protein [Streptomyces sp. NPDC046862]|uniref:hypothetical protein n=1 Tax=Streptomyces sp. NPDC046862 TaxID=3154603 RepID=UPI003456068A
MRSTLGSAAGPAPSFCTAEDRETPCVSAGLGVAPPDGPALAPSEQDLVGLPLPTNHTVRVDGSIEPQGMIPISYGRPYYVAPQHRSQTDPDAAPVGVTWSRCAHP